jgi:hypothetical protein
MPLNASIYDLHRALFWVSLCLGMVLLMFVAQAMRQREQRVIELLWLSFPCALLLLVAMPATVLLMHFDK